MIHKCFCLGIVTLNPGNQRKNIVQKTERLQEILSHIICELNFGVACGLIDNALHIAITKIHITIIGIVY